MVSVDNCLPLSPPQNGALSCLMGEMGWDCMFHCDAAWDLSASTGYFDGHLFCNSESFETTVMKTKHTCLPAM